MNVDLEHEEWQRIISVLMQAPWNVANPLLVKISQQLEQQKHGNSRDVSEPQHEAKAPH